MIDRDADIIAWHDRTGTTGRGEPAFADNAVSVPVPCEIAEINAHRQAQLDRIEVRADLTVRVTRQSIASQGIVPEVGGRLVIRRVEEARDFEGTVYDITRVQSVARLMVVIDLVRTHDGISPATVGGAA